MDLNLVRTFVAVYEARTLTAAAALLHVTQPAVSQALGRLRDEFDDRLFARDGRTMTPTALADSLYPDFRSAIDGVDRAVDLARGFDPASAGNRFRIALSELGEIGYFPAILAAVQADAPGVGIEVVPLEIAELPRWLAEGVVDLAITSSPVPGRQASRTFRTEQYVVLTSDRHPLATGTLDLAAYLAARHVGVSGDSGWPVVEAALAREGARIAPRVVVNRFASLPALLVGGDLVATVPARLARRWSADAALAIGALPFEMRDVEVRLYVRSTSRNAAALDWFHRTVRDALDAANGSEVDDRLA